MGPLTAALPIDPYEEGLTSGLGKSCIGSAGHFVPYLASPIMPAFMQYRHTGSSIASTEALHSVPVHLGVWRN